MSCCLELERLTDDIEQRKISSSSTGLDRAKAQLAADSLELLADMDGPGVEVDIAPADAK